VGSNISPLWGFFYGEQMTEQQLQHIYQAWQQGNEHYARDWAYFVEYAAKRLGTTGDTILRVLHRCHWFEKDDIDIGQ
jgi:hypothetical protein